MRRSLILTDLTEMHNGHFCIAGWDAAARRMVRPLLPFGRHWGERHIGIGLLWPGKTMHLEEADGVAAGPFPHGADDMTITGQSMSASAAATDWVERVRDSESGDLSRVFDCAVKWHGTHYLRFRPVVPAGTQCRSLGAISVRAGRLSFVESNGKLAAYLSEHSVRWRLPVVGHALKCLFREGGAAALQNAFGNCAVHVRLGLSRPFGEPRDACYVMVNGVYPLP